MSTPTITPSTYKDRPALRVTTKTLTALFEAEWGDSADLPREYRLRMLAAGFVETLVWWAEGKYQAEPEAVAGDFLRLFGGGR